MMMNSSGKAQGGRSNFSQTCSLLSQFLKEKGSFEDLSLSLNKNTETTRGTMNLFPMADKPGQNPGSRNPSTPQNIPAGRYETPNLSGMKPEPETAPMTIFYAGQVIVFNDFPADKAQEIMNMASKSRNHHVAAVPRPLAAQSPAESTTSTQNVVPSFGIQPVLGADLPLTRRLSLARFLEKRKDRVIANAPYQVNKPEAAPAPAPSPLKAVKAEPWLGLGPEFSR